MEYRRLGRSGLEISALGLGSWLTFGPKLDIHGVRESIRLAVDNGINFFDNAEVYANGVSELLMGEALKSFVREDLIISTKIYWGGEGPNKVGLNWKRMVEGTKNSLKRLQLDYVDLLFCHRPDTSTPIEETMRAIETLIQQGLVFYWGTSEWGAAEIEQAYLLAEKHHLTPPTMEQPEYNLFNRQKMEEEYLPLFQQHGLGTTIWSPLHSGLLTGKYLKEVPVGSRYDQHEWLRERVTQEMHEATKSFVAIATELGCSPAQLAIAWCLKNPHVSSVLIGATSQKQLLENIGALQVTINSEIAEKIKRLCPTKMWYSEKLS